MIIKCTAMKKINKYLVFAAFLFIPFLGFSQKKFPEALNRKWMMVSFKNYKKNDLIKAKAFVQFENAKMLNGYMGCNQLSFTVKSIQKNKIAFGQGISTQMYCQDFMNLEGDFVKELSKMKLWKVEGHYLTFSDGKGKTMKFIAEDWD